MSTKIIIAGTSGGFGKLTVLELLKRQHPELQRAV